MRFLFFLLFLAFSLISYGQTGTDGTFTGTIAQVRVEIMMNETTLFRRKRLSA